MTTCIIIFLKKYNYIPSLTLVLVVLLIGCKCNSISNKIVTMKPYFTDSALTINTTLDPNLYGKCNHFEYYGVKEYCKNDSLLIKKIENIIFQRSKKEMEVYHSYGYYFFETKNGEHPNKKFHFDSINKLST